MVMIMAQKGHTFEIEIKALSGKGFLEKDINLLFTLLYCYFLSK